MSYLEKLLNGAEVDWKKLGEVVKNQRGKRLVKSELEEFGNYAVFQNSMTPLLFCKANSIAPVLSLIVFAPLYSSCQKNFVFCFFVFHL